MPIKKTLYKSWQTYCLQTKLGLSILNNTGIQHSTRPRTGYMTGLRLSNCAKNFNFARASRLDTAHTVFCPKCTGFSSSRMWRWPVLQHQGQCVKPYLLFRLCHPYPDIQLSTGTNMTHKERRFKTSRGHIYYILVRLGYRVIIQKTLSWKEEDKTRIQRMIA